jgi:hypothetical protein
MCEPRLTSGPLVDSPLSGYCGLIYFFNFAINTVGN